jgi:DNA-binding MarR family transcriptional regulator
MSTETATLVAPAPLSTAELAAWRGLRRVHAVLVRDLDAALEQAHGLSLSSYEALQALSDAGEARMRMCELADSARLSRSGLTRLADRLEQAGLMERACCESDARGSFAVLTAEGRALLAEAEPTYVAVVRSRLLAALTANELTALAELFERVLAAAPPGDCCA